jgi:acid phosphatase type 7
VSYDSGGECGIPTQTRFPAPTATPSMSDEGWFSFVHGSATVVMVNTEFELGPGSTQWQFVTDALSGVNRSVTPWVIVGGHRPIYIVDDVPSGGSIDPAFAVLEPLLMKYQVDVVLVGHVHNAYVTCPVYNGTCVAPPAPGEYAGPVHISIGNAGQGLTPINNTTRPAWATYQASEYGYATLHIWNSTALDVQLFGDDDNGLRTTMSLRRSFPRAGW